ncbi:hypothetical protein TNCV_1131351 [Trichonephila clavipes]|nr:hypothetical protein TNCV_1131351 [Trichonephila clavipes]
MLQRTSPEQAKSWMDGMDGQQEKNYCAAALPKTTSSLSGNRHMNPLLMEENRLYKWYILAQEDRNSVPQWIKEAELLSA